MKPLKEQFVDWVRTKPRDEEYQFFSLDDGECGCAMTQFTYSKGIVAGSQSWANLHDHFTRELIAKPRTFGALSDRLSSDPCRISEGGEG